MCSRVWGIGPVGGGDDQDGAVHLGGAGDHVLDVVGVARAVDVRVVARVGLVLDVGDGDGDAALALLGRVVDRVEGAVLGLALQARYLVMAAVSDVLPWSMWPIVPMLTCGLVRSNFFLAMLLLVPIPLRAARPRAEVEPTLGLEPKTSSLPRKCSAS